MAEAVAGPADAKAVEGTFKRAAPDGRLYTKTEFFEFFRGLTEWDDAEATEVNVDAEGAVIDPPQPDRRRPVDIADAVEAFHNRGAAAADVREAPAAEGEWYRILRNAHEAAANQQAAPGRILRAPVPRMPHVRPGEAAAINEFMRLREQERRGDAGDEVRAHIQALRAQLRDDDRQVRLACKCRILCGRSQDLRPP